MKILCIGDVVSHEGIDHLFRVLPRLKQKYHPDCVIVNGENSALGNGIDKISYDMLISAGADVVTGGNHSFQKKTADDLHDNAKRLIRPANVLGFDAGEWEITLDYGRETLRVINLSGSLFMSECTNPFEFIEKALEDNKNCVTVVDFHAEATSEKKAFGQFVDGKVSAVFGTHTHVQTNDACVLPNGTGYITDIGMTGVEYSVLGKDSGVCIHNFRYPDDRQKIQDAKGKCTLSGVFFETDPATKKCINIETVNE